MSKQKIQLSDHFDYSLPFAVRAALHRHHAVHLHLRRRGRPVRLELCGQNGFAAVNLIMPLPMLVGSVGFMLGTGGSAS